MNRLSKFTALLLAILLVLSLAACSAGESSAAYKVGICQLVQHDAHNSATQGFMDALNEVLPGQVSFNVQNASNEIPVCTSIVNQFIAEDTDLIMANATPALQAAASATAEIPILGTSVTDYAAVMGIADFSGTVGGNVSGTSDLVSVEKQAEMVQAWFPDAKNIGMLFCSAEANSRYQVDVMTEALEQIGYSCTEFSFTDANDLPSVLTGAAETCDLLYVPTMPWQPMPPLSTITAVPKSFLSLAAIWASVKPVRLQLLGWITTIWATRPALWQVTFSQAVPIFPRCPWNMPIVVMCTTPISARNSA